MHFRRRHSGSGRAEGPRRVDRIRLVQRRTPPGTLPGRGRRSRPSSRKRLRSPCTGRRFGAHEARWSTRTRGDPRTWFDSSTCTRPRLGKSHPAVGNRQDSLPRSNTRTGCTCTSRSGTPGSPRSALRLHMRRRIALPRPCTRAGEPDTGAPPSPHRATRNRAAQRRRPRFRHRTPRRGTSTRRCRPIEAAPACCCSSSPANPSRCVRMVS